MARYIDADLLIEELRELQGFHFPNLTTLTNESIDLGLSLAIKSVRKAPIADVVEVVRCSDCKYWQDNNGGYPHEDCRWGKDETPDVDDFCSYGEKDTEMHECKYEERPPTEKCGIWIINPDGYYPYCSKCRYEPYKPLGDYDNRTPYCPNCGIKMKKEYEKEIDWKAIKGGANV